MKKVFSIGAVILVICIALYSLGSDSNKIERSDTGKGNIGDYYIEIKNYAVETDEEGNPVLAINYGFTNNSDDSATFDFVVDDDVFQNGIGLECVYRDKNINTSVQSGGLIDIVIVYALNDNSDVDVELSDVMGEFDDKVTATIKISE